MAWASSDVRAADLNVHRRGHAEVKDGVHQAAGLEIGGHLRQFLLQSRPHAIHVLEAAGLAVLLQTDLHERGVLAGVRSVDGRKTGGDADVGDDNFHIVGGNDFADDIFDLLDQLLGDLQPRAGRRLEIDDELAGIGARKIGFADQRIERQAEDEKAGDAEDGAAGRSKANFTERS